MIITGRAILDTQIKKSNITRLESESRFVMLCLNVLF